MTEITVDLVETVEIIVDVDVGIQGPQGPQGPAGGTAVTYTAGEDLAAGRVVIIDAGEAFYFQPSLSAHQGRAYGVVTSAASLGEDASIQIGGEITNASFTFGDDTRLWVDADGEIVDTPPSVTVLQSAGTSAGSLTMRIDFSFSLLTT